MTFAQNFFVVVSDKFQICDTCKSTKNLWSCLVLIDENTLILTANDHYSGYVLTVKKHKHRKNLRRQTIKPDCF